MPYYNPTDQALHDTALNLLALSLPLMLLLLHWLRRKPIPRDSA